MKTDLLLHGQARKKILQGVNLVYNAVRLSLGVEGGNALIHRAFNRGSRITNDGVTIAKCIQPRDPFLNLPVIAFVEGASKTGERAGDGTSSTIVISGKLINDTFSQVGDESKADVQFKGVESSNKMGVIALKKHILAQITKVKEAIAKVTIKVENKEELKKIADVSLGGNEEIAQIIADMVWKTGTDGFITLADGFNSKLEIENIEGARFPMKIAAPAFMNNPAKFEMLAEECDTIVTNYKLDSEKDFAFIWNGINPDPKKMKAKIIVFAPDFSDEVLTRMVKLMFPKDMNGNISPTGFKIFPAKCPSLRTDQFEDLAVFLDARFIDKNKGDKLSDIKEFDLGFVEKCIVKSVEDREDAVLLGGKGSRPQPSEIKVEDGMMATTTNKVKERIAVLKEQIEKTKMPEHRALLLKRIASLASAGGIIKVGAPTEAEALPLKHKIEDAIFATQAALRFGYVKGGGLCLKEIADELYADDQLIKNALSAPNLQIQENYGGELEIGEDIIDPAKVVELEVEHGFGVAANLITCKAIIPEVDERDNKDGYKLISDAIEDYVYYFAKREGLLEGGRAEAKAEAEAKREYMMGLEND